MCDSLNDDMNSDVGRRWEGSDVLDGMGCSTRSETSMRRKKALLMSQFPGCLPSKGMASGIMVGIEGTLRLKEWSNGEEQGAIRTHYDQGYANH